MNETNYAPLKEKRIEKFTTDKKRRYLQQSESAQEYAIIQHYASLAVLAHDAMKIIKIEGAEDDKNAREVVKLIVKTIKGKHKEDFGLELEWKNYENE